MPIVLEPPKSPPSSPPRERSFARRLAVSGLRFLIIVAISAFLGGGWYLARKGFGRQWRLRVVEELHKRGVEASIRRLTLDPFRGLVAQDVRIFDYKNRENTLALISEISLDINYAAFFHHQPFLNALDVRDAQITLPLKRGDNKNEKPQLKHFHAHIYFPPEQIYVSQAEGLFCGVRISATGQLIKRENYQPSPPISDEEWEKRMAIVRRLIAELQKLSFPSGPPSLQLKFSGDVADIENARVEATLRAERVRRDKYELNNLSATAEWSSQTLALTQCEWKDNAGTFSGRGNWNRPRNEATFQARSSIELKSLFDAFGFSRLLGDTTLSAPPIIEVSGSGDFNTTPPKLNVIGHASVGSFAYRKVQLGDLALDFSWNGERLLLRDLRLRHQSGQLSADLLDAPSDFRLNVKSTISPAVFQAFASPELGEFLNEWEWPRSPNVQMSIRGQDHNPETWHGEATVALERTRFRGVWMNNASATVRFGDGAVTYENLRVTRDEGVGTGGFTYDFKNHEVRINNIKSSLRPADIIFWIDPHLSSAVAPYKFHQPAHVAATGVYQFRGGKNTRLNINVDAPNGMDYVFLGKTLPFDRISGKLLFTNDRLQILDLKSNLFGGSVRGSADISLARDDPKYRANLNVSTVDFPKLTDLYYQYKTAQGQLNGTYDFTGIGSDARHMRGTGKVEVTNGSVFAIPVFGPLSEIFNEIVPGSGYSIARSASASFTIKDGVIHTEDFDAAGKLFDMLGHGDIHFLDDKLDFEIRLDAHGAGILLKPVYKLFEYVGEGSLKKPNWHPKRF